MSVPITYLRYVAYNWCFFLHYVTNPVINDLLKEVEQAELGIELSNGASIAGILFADDYVGVSDCCGASTEAYICLSKSAVMVFARDMLKWGEPHIF